MRGFEDTRGTLFFDIARIIAEKKPKYFVLENVKQLMGHDKGKTLSVIIETLKSLGYAVRFKVLNALDFGLPQKRERIWIVGSLDGLENFDFPVGNSSYMSLDEILEKNIPASYYASNYIKEKRKTLTEHKKFGNETTIWHENKSGNISAYPYSCALRAGASYNYLLVNGERRLLPREMLRLQGFPESFKISVSDTQIRKQAGNSLPVNVAESVIHSLLQQGIINVKSKIKNSRKIQAALPDQSISVQFRAISC
jgi:DNA (cytosine-5)-methyltransferase 1